jgi:ABC-type transport system involved in multi-copper enzyme maturation permease subunit
MMGRILLVATNVFRSVLHGRLVYLWLAGIALMFLRALPTLFFNFGNEEIQTVMRKRAVSGGLDTWSTLCIALAIFLGAMAVGTEINKKTIVTVLSRPLHRWEFLLGKWIGIQCFALLSLFVGLGASFGLSRYLDAEFESKVLLLSLAHTAVAILLYSGLAMAISTLLTPGVAGALTVIVVFLPAVVTLLVDDSDPRYHAAGVALNYIVPSGYTSHYAEAIPAPLPRNPFGRGGFGRGSRGSDPVPGGDIPPVPQARTDPSIDYGAETRVLFKNVGYGAVFFVLGCLVFLRRDLRLS